MKVIALALRSFSQRRWAWSVVASIALGFVASWLVAWLINWRWEAWGVRGKLYWFDRITLHSDAKGTAPEGRLWMVVGNGFGPASAGIFTKERNKGWQKMGDWPSARTPGWIVDEPDAVVWGFGWPSVSLVRVVGRTYDRATVNELRIGDDIQLVITPYWPGVCINTVFYSLVAFVFVAGVPIAWRCARHLRGRCACCGYNLHSLTDGCPECGDGRPESSGSEVEVLT